jgi:hypothetical protein
MKLCHTPGSGAITICKSYSGRLRLTDQEAHEVLIGLTKYFCPTPTPTPKPSPPPTPKKPKAPKTFPQLVSQVANKICGKYIPQQHQDHAVIRLSILNLCLTRNNEGKIIARISPLNPDNRVYTGDIKWAFTRIAEQMDAKTLATKIQANCLNKRRHLNPLVTYEQRRRQLPTA